MGILSYTQEKWIADKLGEDLGRKKLELLEKYCEKWELREVELKQSLSHNSLIFYAVSEKYGEVVFKILLNNGFDKEIAALRAFQGERFVSLYKDSSEDMVYLLERLIPGTTLYEGTTRDERIKVISGIFKGLHHNAPENGMFPSYYDWFKSGESGVRDRRDCDIFRPYLEKAGEIILSIGEKYPRKLLLHGDLHHENILKTADGSYKVIDPKGVIGDPVFDLSRFILDEFRDDLTSEPKKSIIDFVEKLGKGVDIPGGVLLKCLFAETVIWLFREELAGGASLEECEGLIDNMKIAYELGKCEYA